MDRALLNPTAFQNITKPEIKVTEPDSGDPKKEITH